MGSERRIPYVTAIIAVVLSAIVILGIAMIITNRLTDTGGDIALHIDGTWETATLTYNDEHIIYVFDGDIFTSTTETVIFDANMDIIDSIQEYYRVYSGAIVIADDIGDGNFFLTITMDGTFSLVGDRLLLLSGEGILREVPFFWDDDAILINDERFVRRYS